MQLGQSCQYSRKAARTPLTRSNLNAAEDRIRNLESAFSSLLPGIDLDTVLSSVKSQNLAQSSSGNETQAAQKIPPAPSEEENQGRNSSLSPAPESLPLEADGFDWSESAVSLGEIADGMAALSINPEGAGYLGKYFCKRPQIMSLNFIKFLLTRTWSGATSSVVPLRTLFGKDEDRSSNTEFDGSQDWHTQSLLSQQMPFLLPENTFVDAYFQFYHPTYPFLYQPLFRSQFEGMSPRNEGSWPILLNVVLALGAWCMGEEESGVNDYLDQKLARLCEKSVFESGSLALVQALLLLSNYTQKRNKPNTGWNYLGLAVRMALSLGLHKEFPNWEISLLQREMRRRVWWGLFIFDSGASITFGRPVLLPQQGIMDASHVLNITEEVRQSPLALRRRQSWTKSKQSLTAQTVLLPAELPQTTMYTPLICQSHFHLTTNALHHRLISSPGPTPQELLVLNQTIDIWDQSIPSYFSISNPDLKSDETSLFARYRLSWRSWNLKILLSRPVVLQWALRLRNPGQIAGHEASEESECRKICTQSASATINSISDFMSKGIVSRLSTWYMLYALSLAFQYF